MNELHVPPSLPSGTFRRWWGVVLALLVLGAAAAFVWRSWEGQGGAEPAPPPPSPPPPAAAGQIDVDVPDQATVFSTCELGVRFGAGLEALGRLPEAQVHDAYDADRDGAYLRIDAEFRHETGRRVTVPGFAMREEPLGPWQWRVRWSPRLSGRWDCRVKVEGCAGKGGERLRAERAARPVVALVEPGVDGPLVAPAAGDAPGYLRRLEPDGTSRAVWLFGACRAWVVDLQDPNNDWHPHEWLDRDKELLAPMRAAGFNLLNQWMAPWEFLVVHHDRAEFWRDGEHTWRRHELPASAAWSPWQCYDQGRARAFDELVRLCEGGPGRPTVHLLLSPLPHQCLQLAAHPWGAQESGWSPADDAGKQTRERLNGFSAFKPQMQVWEFFQADPAAPLGDWRAQLFDGQANYFRYLVARWGASRALGLWVLVDELDAVGDEVGVMAAKKGWWAHPECDRWLADVVRLFRGELRRSDGLAYPGDPYRHPLHAATTSFGGGAGRGGNLDWPGGPEGARPDLFGWHWYPAFGGDAGWAEAWARVIDGVASYARAPIGDAPRLVSEFGAPDRSRPADEPSALYPTLYHHAAWAAVMSGQAGTPMDWDDGKQFGELAPRERQGIFSRQRYPIDNAAELRALRAFLGDLAPDGVRSCAMEGAAVRCVPDGRLRAMALCAVKPPAAVWGWLYSPDGTGRFSLEGLPAGKYRITWFDPWTGGPVPGREAEDCEVKPGGALVLDAAAVLSELRTSAAPFPAKSRKDRGRDVAFKLTAE